MFYELGLLLALLSSPDWTLRENVGSHLQKCPDHVLRLCELSSDPEVKWRVSSILEQMRVQECKALIAASQPVPWIDALPPDYPNRAEVIQTFLQLARDMNIESTDGPPHWKTYRFAMEVYLYTLPPEEVRKILAITPKDRWWGGTDWVIAPKPSTEEK